jgi:DNA-binding XRE family transcriptional regulator
MVNRRGKGYKVTQQITKDEMEVYAETFRTMRESIRFTQEEMAEAIGVFRTTVYRWEKGRYIPKRDIKEILEDYKRIVNYVKSKGKK